MSTISLRVKDKEADLIKKYAELNHMDVSTFIRKSVMERIEDEYDLALFDKIWNSEQADDRITHEAVKQDLGL